MTEELAPDFTILALETSCDETAAAVIRGGRTIISNEVASQMHLHERYGGVVPEVASREHILSMAPVIEAAIAPLPGGWADIDAVDPYDHNALSHVDGEPGRKWLLQLGVAASYRDTHGKLRQPASVGQKRALCFFA